MVQWVAKDRGVFSGVLVTGQNRVTMEVVHTYHRVNVDAMTVCSRTSGSSLRIRLTSRDCYMNNGHITSDCLGVPTVLAITIRDNTRTVRPNCKLLSRGTGFISLYRRYGVGFVNPSSRVVGLLNSGSGTEGAVHTTNIPMAPNYSVIRDIRRTGRRTRGVNFPLLVGTHSNNNKGNVHHISSVRRFRRTFLSTSDRTRSTFNSNTYCVRGFVRPMGRVRVRLLYSGCNGVIYLNRHRYSIREGGRGVVRRDPDPTLSRGAHGRVVVTTIGTTGTIGCIGTNAIRFLLSVSGGFCFVRVGAHLRIRRNIARVMANLSVIR